MKKNFTTKFSVFTLLMGILFTFQFCTASKKAGDATDDSVSYKADIAPLMVRSCSPCHFPPEGRVEALDSYGSVKSHINEILERVQLAEDAEGYMPFKSKKEAFSADEIGLFKTWMDQGMAK